jgi:Tol biopolymer transport system component
VRTTLLLSALVWVAGSACAHPGFDYKDLPDAPIALTYRTLAESERVAELRTRGMKMHEPGKLTVRVQELGDVLGIGRSREDRAGDLLGRLAFVDPRTQRLRFAEFSQRGSRPLSWAPGHERLLYLGFPQREAQVFEVTIATGEVRPVTRGPEEHLDASYGPDGRLALARATPKRPDGPGGVRIFVREPGGGAPAPVTPGPADHRPRWSPDGRLLVYEGAPRDGMPAIYGVDPAGGGEPQLLARGRSPVFTPDSQWVIYSARTRDGYRLWKMRPDGSGKLRLGSSPYEEHDPAVSPDGRFVVFVSSQDDRQKLMLRSIEGRGDRPLVLDGDAIRPTW